MLQSYCKSYLHTIPKIYEISQQRTKKELPYNSHIVTIGLPYTKHIVSI